MHGYSFFYKEQITEAALFNARNQNSLFQFFQNVTLAQLHWPAQRTINHARSTMFLPRDKCMSGKLVHTYYIIAVNLVCFLVQVVFWGVVSNCNGDWAVRRSFLFFLLVAVHLQSQTCTSGYYMTLLKMLIGAGTQKMLIVEGCGLQ